MCGLESAMSRMQFQCISYCTPQRHWRAML